MCYYLRFSFIFIFFLSDELILDYEEQIKSSMFKKGEYANRFLTLDSLVFKAAFFILFVLKEVFDKTIPLN